ncbi:hypothetical protein B0H17DRAFT_1196972 [Mycena rosella]|uniref:Uncharacterized protein n=1 Tax=Mycena rosella TaxID=1033263 RepID=A0AAD7DUM0_MYCRO|nr:hypothetical protein B0H17DRAFT_1196972 [Mycena rosella]
MPASLGHGSLSSMGSSMGGPGRGLALSLALPGSAREPFLYAQQQQHPQQQQYAFPSAPSSPKGFAYHEGMIGGGRGWERGWGGGIGEAFLAAAFRARAPFCVSRSCVPSFPPPPFPLYPSQAGRRQGRTMHNADDLRSYEAAVLARKAPELVLRKSARRPATSAGPLPPLSRHL